MEHPLSEVDRMVGGLAVADVDGDGDLDVFAVGGDAGEDALFVQRDGTFHLATDAGITSPGGASSGPLFADLDSDGDPDLWVGGVGGVPIRVFINDGRGHFRERAGAVEGETPGVATDTYSATAADVDGDGDLDVFVARWSRQEPLGSPRVLFRNDGGAHFSDASEDTGLSALLAGRQLTVLTGNFADLDEDGRLDLLLAADFGQAKVLLATADGRFRDATDATIDVENAMGATLGDFDGDGHWDWFVTSIFDGDGTREGFWGITGNRLYLGNGDGSFRDATEQAGVTDGGWGWATCAADFDRDGALDIFHVNGFDMTDEFTMLGMEDASTQFHEQPSRLFMGQGQVRFREVAERAGVADRGYGIAVSCADLDADGDVDILSMNNDGALQYFRNDTRTRAHYVALDLMDLSGNPSAVGAELTLSACGHRQRRLIRAGSNFQSQDPMRAFFGLGTCAQPPQVDVRWPDGHATHRQLSCVDCLEAVDSHVSTL